jgi:hypothetical protein|nr:MAG TPA: hypothetical protein [Bacteriophage sp.]
MIKKIKSKEYALGVERMDKEVGAPTNIAQPSMLMAAYEAGWDGAMRHLGGMYVDDAIMELLLERIIDNVELPLSNLIIKLSKNE